MSTEKKFFGLLLIAVVAVVLPMIDVDFLMLSVLGCPTCTLAFLSQT